MEEIKELLIEAERKLSNVDHLLSVTFPVLNDSKILAPIAETLAQSALKALEALLCYERAYKRIHILPTNIDLMIDLFKTDIARRYKFERGLIVMLNDLKNLLQSRKKSAAEFVKNDKYVICSNEYYTTIITSEKLKSYKLLTANFINQVRVITSRRV